MNFQSRPLARKKCCIYDEFKSFLDSPGDKPRRAKRFVLCALQQPHKVEVSRLLSTNTGNSLLRTLLDIKYPNQNNECFEEFAIPLCYLLSDKQLVACNATYRSKIYRVVLRHVGFFDSYFQFLKVLSDSMASNLISDFRIQNGLDAIIPFMDLGFFILTRFGIEMSTNRMKVEQIMRETVTDLVTRFRTVPDNEVRDMNLWLDLLDRSKARLESVFDLAEEGQIETSFRQSVYLTREYLDALERITMESIFPNEDEILSCQRTIQHSDEVFRERSSPSFEDVAWYIKHQFNHMRQEIIMPHRAALRHMIRESLFSSKPEFLRFRDDFCEGLCDLFWDVQVEDIDTRIGRGGCFRLSFEQRYKYDNLQERRNRWNPKIGGLLLEKHAVVCLMFYDPDILFHDLDDAVGTIPDCKLLFGHVSTLKRNDLDVDHDRSFMEVSMESETDISRLIEIVYGKSGGRTRRSAHNQKAVMLQVRSSFINEAHGLCKSLQNSDWANLSWAMQLAQTKQVSPLSAGHSYKSMWEDSSSRFVDLSFLVRDGVDSLATEAARQALQSVDTCDRQAIHHVLRQHADCIMLDDSQMKSFSLCLGKGLSLIQGNPAFGEAVLVSCIVKALLSRVCVPKLRCSWNFVKEEATYDFGEQENFSSSKILCVGLSNSSIDEVLEKLISMGFLSKGDVLRLGGRSESDILQDRSLNELRGHAPPEVPKNVRSRTEALIRTGANQFRTWFRGRCPNVNTLQRSANWIFQLSETLRSMTILDDLGSMRDVKVIGCTTSGAVIYGDLIRALCPSTIIFLGSNGMHDSSILGVQTSSTESVILTGDHLQPGPFNTTRLRQQGRSADEVKDTFLFKRLLRMGAVPSETLTVQYQMHPALSKLAQVSYNQINDSDHVQNYPNAPKGLENAVFFLDHSTPEETDLQSQQHVSRVISCEIDFASSLVQYLILQGCSQNQIAVLSPSHLHLMYIKERLRSFGIGSDFGDKTRYSIVRSDLLPEDMDQNRKQNILSRIQGKRKRKNCIKLSTIWDFVNRVRDVVIVSMALGNESGSIGEFQSDSLVNRMITSARYGMIILGSSATIRNASGGKALKDVVDRLEKESLLGTTLPLRCQEHGKVTHVTITDELLGRGGCDVICNKEMACGHRCLELCHPPHFRCFDTIFCDECDRD